MLPKNVKWIFCGGMIRSGSTLQYQLVCNLVERAGLGSKGGFYDGGRELDEYASPQGITVVKSHIFDMHIQKTFLKDEAIAFYIYRDIRDVAVSAMYKFSVTFADLLNKQWLDYAINVGSLWESQNKVRSFRYEESTNDIEGFIKATADYLGIEINIGDIQELAQEHSLTEQRKRADYLKQRGLKIDDVTQLHSDHIFTGTTGIWRESLDRIQQDTLNILYGDWLRQKDYEVSQEDNNLAESIAHWRKGDYMRQRENVSNLIRSRAELTLRIENMQARLKELKELKEFKNVAQNRIKYLVQQKTELEVELNALKHRYRLFEKLLGR